MTIHDVSLPDGPEEVYLYFRNNETFKNDTKTLTYHYNITDGSPFGEIYCKATCHPECAYQWTKEPETINNKTESVLDLGVANKNSSGRYVCTVSGTNDFKTTVTLDVKVICE